MFEEMDEILTPDDVCEILKIGKNALYELLLSGRLHAYRNGRCWRIPKRAVSMFIYEQANLK